jgi:hypothetical protein
MVPVEQQRFVLYGAEIIGEEVAEPAGAFGDAEQRIPWRQEMTDCPLYLLQERVADSTYER